MILAMDKEQALVVTSDRGRLVTKANSLIDASYILTLNEQRIILACASKLDGRKPMPKDGIFVLAAKEFMELFGADEKNAYAALKEAADRLYERDIKRIEGKGRTRMRWVYKAHYQDGEGLVKIGFSPEIAPYLTMLHKQFTSYRLQDVASLGSPYAIRLYEMLAQYASTGLFVISVDDLKERLGLTEKYARFSNFRSRVIQPSVDDVVAHTMFDVQWKAIKKGRTTIRLEFRFEEKQQLKLDL